MYLNAHPLLDLFCHFGLLFDIQERSQFFGQSDQRLTMVSLRNRILYFNVYIELTINLFCWLKTFPVPVTRFIFFFRPLHLNQGLRKFLKFAIGLKFRFDGIGSKNLKDSESYLPLISLLSLPEIRGAVRRLTSAFFSFRNFCSIFLEVMIIENLFRLRTVPQV